MNEAHRRADTSEDVAWVAWNNRSRMPRTELSAAVCIAVAGFAWFTLRGAIDVSSTPWQGLMLNGAYPVPLFAEWLSIAALTLEPPMGLVLLNVFVRALGAITCAGVAVLVVNGARRIGTVAEAWLCGVLAGAVLFLAPGVTSAFTAAWPGAITVACAIWALVALTYAAQSRARSAPWLIGAAALCAVSAAGHAFFAWLALPFLGVTMFAWRHKTVSVYGALSALLTWTPFLAMPAVNALVIRRERPDLFLGRVLRGAYPAVAEQAPDWRRIADLGGQFHPLVWILAMAAVILLFQRHARIGVCGALALFAVAGPLAPFLMSHYDSGAFIRDEASIEVMALAGVAMVLGLGLAAAMQVIFRQSHALAYRAGMVTLVFAIVALHQWTVAPDRRSDLSGAFARSLLDGCPRQSVLIVEDPAIAGMLNAAQYAYKYRTDVRVVPAGVLLNPAARQYYRNAHPNGVHVDTFYDTQQHAASWQRERPLVTNALLNADVGAKKRRIALDDLILWEFVRDNFGARPIAFAGADVEWVHARAAINGLVQLYPRAQAPLTDTMEAWLAMRATRDIQVKDPELAHAFSQILLSLSATRRAQNRGDDATRLAALATRFEHGGARPWMALARAAARNGSREDAKVYSETGLRLGNGDATETAALLQQDYDAYDLVATYRSDLDDSLDDPDARFRRQELAADLWMKDEIAALVDLMARELELEPRTARDLYEMAAAQAQFGNIDEARRYLMDAVALSPDEVAEHLEGDGRFVLLEVDQLPSPHETSL